MTGNEWTTARNALVRAVAELGFQAELGDAVAKHLGSPKAIERMTQYLLYVKPHRVEMIVDEMLAIRSEIAVWKEKKGSREASVKYNEMLYFGLMEENEEERE